MFHRKKGVTANYKMNTVFRNAEYYFPMIDRSLCVDKKNRLLLTGKDVCHLFARHSTQRECKKSFREYKNRTVRKHIDGKKAWCNSDMFAYVKDNRLYLTGCAASFDEFKCYGNEPVKTFLEGKGNKIKEVVCGGDDPCGNSNIFVLMKDGSVWGMGNNECKMLSDSEQEYYSDFIKIIPGGVKTIAAADRNVAVIRKDGSLYVWGRTLKSRKKKFSFVPEKIAADVKEVSISDTEYETDTILVYLKKNNVAYGLGENDDYALTDRYKKGWNGKPVKLRENIKHVYAAPKATVLLDNNGELYWTGTQDYYNQYDWVE